MNIILANEARSVSVNYDKEQEERQLKDIMSSIQTRLAIDNGKVKYITYFTKHVEIFDTNKQKLKNLGYRLSVTKDNVCGKYLEYCTTISW